MYRLHRKTNWDKGIKDKYITLNNGKVIEELAERRNVYKSSSGFWGEKEGVFVKMASKDDAIGDLPQANWYYDKFLSAKEKNLPAFIIYRPHREKVPYKFQYTNLVNLIEGTKKVVNTYKDLYDGIIFYRFKH